MRKMVLMKRVCRRTWPARDYGWGLSANHPSLSTQSWRHSFRTSASESNHADNKHVSCSENKPWSESVPRGPIIQSGGTHALF